MSDLISREALLNAMDKRYLYVKKRVPDTLRQGFVQMEKLIKKQPTIEAVPVVRAEWKLKQGDEGIHWYCSKCREEALFDIFNYQEKSNFCPNCGARMKGGAE